MKVLIQNCKTGEYLGASGDWTRDPSEALEFENGIKASEYCRDHHIDSAQIILKFSNSAYDVRWPLSPECQNGNQRGRPPAN